jgi:hypothetical protein
LFHQALVALQITKNPVLFKQLKPDDLRIHPATALYLNNYGGNLMKLMGTNATADDCRSVARDAACDDPKTASCEIA